MTELSMSANNPTPMEKAEARFAEKQKKAADGMQRVPRTGTKPSRQQTNSTRARNIEPLLGALQFLQRMPARARTLPLISFEATSELGQKRRFN
jgi:hypothetical protein